MHKEIFGNLKREIYFRNKNKNKNYKLLNRRFYKKLTSLKNNETEDCINILNFLKNNYESKNEVKQIFHPLRVSFYTLSISKSKNRTKACKLALIHNILEKNRRYVKLKDLVGTKIYNQAKVLKVNRKKQWNKKYIDNYYKNLNKSHKNVKIVKCLDKLDNLFSLYKNPDKKIKKLYLDEIKKYILPMVKKNMASVYKYYINLVNYNIKLLKSN